MANKTFHYISAEILSEISHDSLQKTKKFYRRSLSENDLIPLECIPDDLQEKYVNDYLLHGRIIDFAFINACKDDAVSPLESRETKELFAEMKLMRKAYEISLSDHITEKLNALAKENSISYRTLMRKRKVYMNNSSLANALKHGSDSSLHILDEEDMKDRYRTCCYYCRDLIIYLHEQPGKISSAKIYRDLRDAKPFPCSKCPYHPEVKAKKHAKGEMIPSATCRRKEEFMVKPRCEDTVCLIVKRIPEQQDALAWEGVRSWASHYQYAPARERPKVVNEVWFSDHKELDILVRTGRNKDGEWIVRRPWLTAIIDAASEVMVSYVLSDYPNADCIAECFSQACAFTVDTPYCGLPDYFYIDNGKDFRSKKLAGLPNADDDNSPLFLNKNFGESGILEWFGVKVIHALKYRGRSKTIEPIWRLMDREWFKNMPGYCGEKPENCPEHVKEWLRKKQYENFLTFEQLADDFADRIYPEYNSFGVTRETPDDLYRRLPKASSYVPTWRTLAVLKSVSVERVIRPKGIQYDNNYYWNSELGPLIEKDDSTKYRIFAFDTPFNRRISVVKDHTYICEAHLIEKLNVREEKRFKVIQHIRQQQLQHRFYSRRNRQIHSLILQTDVLKDISNAPVVDNIRYGQAIDKEKDEMEAQENNAIPDKLKEQAVAYAESLLSAEKEHNEPGPLTLALEELGRKSRE